jgi:hypothetical protein
MTNSVDFSVLSDAIKELEEAKKKVVESTWNGVEAKIVIQKLNFAISMIRSHRENCA